MLDLVIFTAQLSTSLGPYGTVGLFANYFFTAYVLRSVTPAFGKLAAIQARLEGEYRAGVGRVGREAEEIASVSVPLDGRNPSADIVVTLQLLSGGTAREEHTLEGLPQARPTLRVHLQDPYRVYHDGGLVSGSISLINNAD